MGNELSRIGYMGSTPTSWKVIPLSTHFEVHIEQGSRLESSGRRVAVVTGIQEIRWYRVQVNGQQSHGGSTPMVDRADALVAASKVVLLVETLAKENGGYATVGSLVIEPNAPNCVPGTACFTIDLRHPFAEKVNFIEGRIFDAIREIEAGCSNIHFNIDCIWDSPAVTFDNRAAGCMAEAARETVGPGQVDYLQSFAGHDSAMTALRVPTSMLFVPSRHGISHAPDEFTSKDQWYVLRSLLFKRKSLPLTDPMYSADGIQTLLCAVLEYSEQIGYP